MADTRHHTGDHLEGTITQVEDWFHLPSLTDEPMLHQFGAVCGNDFFKFIFENVVSINSYIQMESNPDSAALAQQVQALAAIIEELTKQNQEMKLQLQLQQVQQAQQEENRSKDNMEGEGDSRRRSIHQRPITPNEQNSDSLRETDRSVDRMVRVTDLPFTTAVLECPVLSKFRLPQLEPFNGLKDPQDHLNTFKTMLGLQQSPDEILCRSFPTTLKGTARE